MPNDFNGPPAELANDGSLHDAAMSMPDFDGMDDPSPAQTTTIIDPREAANRRGTPPVDMRQQRREQDGKFKEGFDVKPNLPPEAEEQDDRAEPEAVAAAGMDDEWFELPPEKEGDKPQRIKAEDVFKGYQEAQELRQALEQVTRITPPPPQYDEEIIRNVQVRQKLVQQLNQLMVLNQPMEPDDELINDRSERYNPAEWHRQKAFYQQQAGRIQAMQQRAAQEQQLIQQEQEALIAARKSREQSKLVQFWPELRDPVVQRTVKDEAARAYGIDDGVFDSVLDARFYAVLRDALAHRQGLKQRQQTVKVVRAKPKLVRGSARDPSGPKGAQLSASMRKLAQSGSIDDAADALGGLI